ncbi:MAG: glucoamylase family protein [Verrucomicrobiota bacterium JB022]|nr:glucoamylase family protein [Verrucomicrobiota bacterium JB022]
MKLPALTLAMISLAAASAHPQSFYDRHVFFDFSSSPHAAEYSGSRVIAPSTLETHEGRFPVDTKRFHSAPNGLRLHWRSAPGGDWQIDVQIPRRYARTFHFEGDALSFWVYPEDEVTYHNSPLVFLRDSAGNGTGTVRLVKDQETLPAGRWTRVTLPFASFHEGLYQGTADPKFRPAELISVAFMQGLDDDEDRTLYLDDFFVHPQDFDDTTPPSVPTRLRAQGAERHVDLSWQPSEADDLLQYRIYRSDDGETFRPIGLQQGHLTRFEDFVGEPGQTVFYQVSAVDLAGNESPLTAPVQAETRPMSDDELLTMVQEACFRYYWEAAHPSSGLAPEVYPGDRKLVALGGNGFGVMALLVATERGFVTREQAIGRMQKILGFLDRAERFHGVWPHFLDAETGKAVPFFGKYDNGGDLVETAFMIQGLLAARQYFDRDTSAERAIRETITRFWEEVEWDWYRKSEDSRYLYWHWSPDHGFHISHPLIGWNETLIIYLLAIASPTHPVPADLYHTGFAGTADEAVKYRQTWSRTTEGDHYVNGNTYYGIPLEVGSGSGSDLFFAHFSFLGFDPRGRRDAYTNYFENNRAIALISQAYAIDNPRGFDGYGADCWGLSAGINTGGGRAQPRDDNGTINVMASLASMPYTPDESMAALKHFYRVLGDRVWGVYGFHDGFNQSQGWFEEVYMALNQAPITVMIENHRSGLVWDLFMANPEIQPALDAIGFHADPAE